MVGALASVARAVGAQSSGFTVAEIRVWRTGDFRRRAGRYGGTSNTGTRSRECLIVSAKSNGRIALCRLRHEKWNRLTSVPAVNPKVLVQSEYCRLRMQL